MPDSVIPLPTVLAPDSHLRLEVREPIPSHTVTYLTQRLYNVTLIFTYGLGSYLTSPPRGLHTPTRAYSVLHIRLEQFLTAYARSWLLPHISA